MQLWTMRYDVRCSSGQHPPLIDERNLHLTTRKDPQIFIFTVCLLIVCHHMSMPYTSDSQRALLSKTWLTQHKYGALCFLWYVVVPFCTDVHHVALRKSVPVFKLNHIGVTPIAARRDLFASRCMHRMSHRQSEHFYAVCAPMFFS